MKKPLYNGYVVQPIGMFVILLFVALSTTATFTYLIIEYVKDCFAPSDFLYVEIQPAGYEFINDCIAITTLERGYLLQQDAIDNSEMLLEKIDQRACMFGSYSTADEKHVRPLLWELRTEDGAINVSVQDTLVAARKSAVRYCLIFSSVIMIIWGLFLGITYVLYNAPRYPRLARLLVREEFRNF